MAIDVLAFGAGAAANAAGNLISERVSPDPTVELLQQIVAALNGVHQAVSRSNHETIVINLGSGASNEYMLPDKGRAHVSILIPSVTMSGGNITTALLTFYIPGVGQLTTTLTLGWTQLDLPYGTRMWTADGNSYSCLLSFRDDPLGTPL